MEITNENRDLIKSHLSPYHSFPDAADDAPRLTHPSRLHPYSEHVQRGSWILSTFVAALNNNNNNNKS